MKLPKPVERRVAINLADVTRIDPAIRDMLLGGKLDLSAPIRTDKDRPDEAAVAFACDDLTAACICDAVRNDDRQKAKPVTRIYVKRKTWVKLLNHVFLTVVALGEPVLNPDVFAGESLKVAAKAPARVEL